MTLTKKNAPVAKYRQIENALKDEVAAGLWGAGQRLPSEYELAERFNVAYLTVRQAVSNLRDAGVLIRVKGKGTFVAGSAAQTNTAPTTRHPMVLLFPANWQRIDPYYFPELWEGFQQAADLSGQQTRSVSYDDAERIGFLKPGSAVACLLLEEAQMHLAERLRDKGHHVMAINHYTGRRSIPCVRIDDAQGVEQLVDYLVGLGHRNIAFVKGDSGNLDAADRFTGFRQAMRRHGLPVVASGEGFQEVWGYLAAQTLLDAAIRPTALVCASDLSALGALKAARERGIICPEDLSVVGFGDFSVGDFVQPRLTTVRQSRIELGRNAAELLVRLANDEVVPDVILQTELLVRDSAALPASSVSKYQRPALSAAPFVSKR